MKKSINTCNKNGNKHVSSVNNEKSRLYVLLD